MNVPRADIADIIAGELDEVHLPTSLPPQPGQVVPVRVKGGRPRCWVHILETWPYHNGGGNVVRFERAPAPHTPRLLARTGRAHLKPSEGQGGPDTGADHGYTSSPFRALGDEPECVPEDWQKDFSEPRSKRDELVRLERVAARRVERWKRKRERKRAA